MSERFPRVRGWCRTHNDFSWLYEDGSGKCFYAYDVEISGSSCDIEAEAAALDVDALARAYQQHRLSAHQGPNTARRLRPCFTVPCMAELAAAYEKERVG